MKTVRLNQETIATLLEDLLQRSPNSYGEYEDAVAEIISNVRSKKDEALFAYTEKFDHAKITAETVQVTQQEIDEAYERVDPALLEVIRKALVNIRSYHEKQKRQSWFCSDEKGTMLGQKILPLQRVGVYVPGGKAVYPSSVLMNVLPAKLPGWKDRHDYAPGKDGSLNPSTLVAAKEAGVDTIYKVGGAQAVAALAYGTQSIPKVDKIVGPGNIFVALAKKAVYGQVGIDSIAGPSEILVLADDTANPRYVAAELTVPSGTRRAGLCDFDYHQRKTGRTGKGTDFWISENTLPQGDHREISGQFWIYSSGRYHGGSHRRGQRHRLGAYGNPHRKSL